MVAAVAQNTVWRNHVAHGGKGSEIVGAADERIKTADQGAGALRT